MDFVLVAVGDRDFGKQGREKILCLGQRRADKRRE